MGSVDDPQPTKCIDGNVTKIKHSAYLLNYSTKAGDARMYFACAVLIPLHFSSVVT